MKMKSYLMMKFVLVCALVISLGASAQTYPTSMATIGDSISRGAVADDTIDDDQPEHVWSTGYDGGDIVNSHLERIRAVNPSTPGYNNAWNGASSDDLLAQSNTTVSQGVEYVTIQMGGNDICGDNTAEMPSVATWEARWNEAIDVLQAGLPGADILVTSVVNVRRVYDVGKYNWGCQLKWNIFTFCENMLTNGSTQRNEATARLLDYNSSLASITSAQGVWYDSDSYAINFSRGQLSSVDCFHPDISLNRDMANVTYDASRF
jgi:lysophospholipase L1-like esterase